jgi:ADP-ribose pyrophosphatase
MANPITLSAKTILETPWLTLEEKRVRSNGHTLDFYIASRKHAANIIAITPDKQVVFVKEYKYGAEEYIRQLPGGKVDEDESPAEAAKREIEEETGYKVTDLVFLGQWYVDAAWRPDVTYLYAALVESQGEHKCEDMELMDVELIDWDEAVRMAESNEIRQPHSAIAILLLRDKLEEVFA